MTKREKFLSKKFYPNFFFQYHQKESIAGPSGLQGVGVDENNNLEIPTPVQNVLQTTPTISSSLSSKRKQPWSHDNTPPKKRLKAENLLLRCQQEETTNSLLQYKEHNKILAKTCSSRKAAVVRTKKASK